VAELRWPELGDTVEIPRGSGWLLARVTEVGSVSNSAGDSEAAFWVTVHPTAVSGAMQAAYPRTERNHGDLWRWPRPAASLAADHLAGRIPRRRGRR
jgi:hypothetical protein